MSSFGIIALTPAIAHPGGLPESRYCGGCLTKEELLKSWLDSASIAVAAAMAGEIGIWNIEFIDLSEAAHSACIQAVLERLNTIESGNCGIKCNITQAGALSQLLSGLSKLSDRRGIQTAILALSSSDRKESIAGAIDSLKKAGVSVLVETTSLEEARSAAASGADGLIAKGHEAGGRVGDQTTFVLIQQIAAESPMPVWAQGGIGLNTASACYVAGAAGVVLDSQLLLTRESPLPFELRQKLQTMDGTETTLSQIGDDAFRFYARAGHPLLAELAEISADSSEDEKSRKERSLKALTQAAAEAKPIDRILFVGQDVCLAANLALRYSTLAGIAQAIKGSVAERAKLAAEHLALAPHSPMAVSHGTEYPIVQGAMTRVSDSADFALKVAEGGGLPFLALALMRKGEVETLVAETKEKLQSLSWGVGILGFVPQQLRQEQLEVISKHRPPYALIAGGRPDQARALEEMGIKTYLHVPSPMLLESFIEMGSRRFIFEGKECGGHVGPRSSFILWEAMIDKLLNAIGPRDDASKYHILFAGGVHDALSSAMVQAMAAPLAARGVRLGVLMGTAYLFTKEAVESGAIVKKFQQAAIQCRRTVLLETGPGHAIRCIESPYRRTFDDRRQELILQEKTRDEIRESLELMNLGRLRIASKGVARSTYNGKDTIADLIEESNQGALKNPNQPGIQSPVKESGEPDSALKGLGADAEFTPVAKQDRHSQQSDKGLVALAEDKQWQDGMYMIGQVALMRDAVCTIKDLHESVSTGGVRRLEAAIAQRLEKTTQTPEPAQTTKTAQTIKTSPETAAKPATRTAQEARAGAPASTPEGIAIVGMSCLFPKASDLDSYWHNILNKVDTITEVPADQWDWRNYYDENPLARDKIYSKWGGFLEAVKFDPTKYGIPPSSLSQIDPMQMLLLELTRSALEDAGYSEREFARQRASVVLANAGHGPVTALYSLRSMLGWKLSGLPAEWKADLQNSLPEWSEDSFPGYLGNVTAGRVANRFDLGGVNFSIDAACASSLAALYVGLQDLRSQRSDVVFLCASDTHNQPGDYLSFSKTHAFSPQGRCRTFDATADGIVISEGMALLILKRVSDAERDGDRIYAVIRGIGGSSDGRDLSLTAPRPAGQVLSLTRAYEDANLSPASVTLIEAHGTGTVAGDKAEIEALKQVFDRAGAERRKCAVGSVKTMIGHTKAAAGLASLIKVAKALHHKVLPPTMGVTVPNPACDFENSPFYVNAEARPWIVEQGQKRRAGVSAFGFGGTNFHAIVEEYVPIVGAVEQPALQRWPSELFLAKGRSRQEIVKSLDHLQESARKALKMEQGHGQDSLRSLAQTNYLKQQDRLVEPGHSNVKELCLAVVASSVEDLIEKLGKARNVLANSEACEIKDPRGVYFVDLAQPENAALASGKVAFLFPGQGCQYVNMLRDLSLHFPEVRETYANADAALTGRYGSPLSSFVFPPPSFTESEQRKQRQELTGTHVAQPAVGAADVAMLKLLASFGVTPDMVAGHSYGEYVSLFAAGVMAEADLYRVSETRGRILSDHKGEPGTMAAVSASAETLSEHLPTLSGVALANVNSPNQCVLSGEKSAIETAITLLKERGLPAKPIAVSQAFHSKHMQRAQAPLRTALTSLALNEPRLPVYSNTDAATYTSQTTVPRLVDHIVKPVDFVSQIKVMNADGASIFIEVGPSAVLSALAESILSSSDVAGKYAVLSTDRPGRNGLVHFLHALAQMAALGLPVQIGRLFQSRLGPFEAGRRIGRSLSSGAQTTAKRGLMYLVNSARVVRLDNNGVPQDSTTQPPVTLTTSARQSQAPDPSATHSDTDRVRNLDSKHTTQRDMTNTNPSKTSFHQPAAAASPAPTAAAGSEALHRTGQPTTGSQTPDHGSESQRAHGSLPSQPTTAAQGPGPGTVSQVNYGIGQARTAPQSPASRAAGTPGAQAPLAQARTGQDMFALTAPVAGAPLTARNVDQVMVQFQKTMLEMTNNFLQTQQQVMLAYLQAKNGQPPLELAGRALVEQEPGMLAQANGQGSDLFNSRPPLMPQSDPSQFLQALSQVGQSATEPLPVPAAAQQEEPLPGVDQFDASQSYEPAEGNSPENLIDSLLEIVSQRTGYPPEMLDPTLDLEADLGIDSIKRVEILNSFRKILPESRQRELEGGIEELAGTKTLQGIIDWINSGPSQSAGAATGNAYVDGNGQVDHHGQVDGNGYVDGNGQIDGNGYVDGNGQIDASGYVDGHGQIDGNGYVDGNGQIDGNGYIDGNGEIDGNGYVDGNGHVDGNDYGDASRTVRPSGSAHSSGSVRAGGNGSEHLRGNSGRQLHVEDLAGLDGNGNKPLSGKTVSSSSGGSGHAPVPQISGHTIRRALVRTLHLAPSPSQASLPEGVIVVADDGFGTGQALVKLLKERKSQAVLLTSLARQSSKGECPCPDLNTRDDLESIISDIHSQYGPIGAIVNLRALDSDDALTATGHLTGMFALAKAVEPHLNDKNATLKRAVVTATRLGGTFGVNQDQQFNPIPAGMAGFIKSLAKEWPNIHCKALDFSRELSADRIAANILMELASLEQVVEVGYTDSNRYTFEVVSQPIDRTRKPSVVVEPGSVVLITGGARGITAELGLELAKRYRPTLILVGRMALPDLVEDPRTAQLSSPKELKAQIMELLKGEGKPVSIAAVEAIYQKILREREIRNNMTKMLSFGAKVEYHCLDVRDEPAFSRLIDTVYKTHGKIDGVIHGAGIIEDSYVKDKTPESFERVVRTKVDSALTLSRRLNMDSLKFLFLFSSVVGRTGNAGQTDYVTANEAINKLARVIDKQTRARVASLMWGPWKGGMAQQELEGIFARYGWAMIDPAHGRSHFIAELEHGQKGDVEVLLVAELASDLKNNAPKGARLSQASVTNGKIGIQEFSLTLDSGVDLYLRDHKFDGVPVMPMAFSLEFMAEAVASAYPGYEIARVNRLDIPSGIVFDTNRKQITIVTEEVARSDFGVRVNVSLNSGAPQRRVHFKSTMELVKTGIHRPPLHHLWPATVPIKIGSTEELLDVGADIGSVPSLSDIYGKWMFHGPIFQGITEIHCLGDQGVTGRLRTSNASQCLQGANGHQWLIDPVLLDSSMQLAGVWARQFLDITVLPTGFKALHLFRPARPGEPLTGRVFINPGVTARELTCEIGVYDSQGELVFLIEGLGGIGSKSLNRLSNQGTIGTVT